MDDIDRIIAGLSEAQRDAVSGAALCRGGEYWHPSQRLFPRNLLYLSRGGVLTETGLAVRARLLQGEG